ncbi:MAG: decaprenyl-phosphate phosphoribosyltransferase [Phycisphaerales bacterium]|nr:decaprenyl-phosphate phosphoribosyltransferase [Phycisphaerales bacterium]
MAFLRLMRPQQWVKNVFVFAGLVFGRKLDHAPSVADALLGFLLLSLISSAVYVMNDLHDREEDRLHPRKRFRPLASGAVSPQSALVLIAALLAASLGGSWLLDRGFFLCVVTYLVLQLFYTFSFKHIAVLDVITIGVGFVLRAIAGAVLVHVEISHWLVVCTFTLCLFMGFSKRRCELAALNGSTGPDAGAHRRTLLVYTPDLLNHMTTVTAGIAVMSYLLYAVDARTVGYFGTNYLMYLTPLVVFAVFRFALLVEHGRVDGPTEVVTRDRPFQAAVLLWGVCAWAVVYHGVRIAAWLRKLADVPPPP